MKNKRLKLVAEKAIRMGLWGGQYELDAYNQIVITNGISFTITTRTVADNNHWLLEIDERFDSHPAGDEGWVR
jgi:hypothetical protein